MFLGKFFKQQKPSITKPPQSKITLSKDSINLQIIIPSKGLNLKATFWFLLILILTIYVSYRLYPIYDFNQSVTRFLIYFPAVFIPIAFIVTILGLEILASLFGELQLISRQGLVFLSYNLFGFKLVSPAPFTQESISEIVTNYSQNLGLISKNHPIEVGTINIWVGKKKYQLGNGQEILDFCCFRLTKSEMDWLASELSYWFGVPILDELCESANQDNSLEYMRIGLIWLVPWIFASSYFLILVGAIGIISNFPKVEIILLVNEFIAVFSGLLLFTTGVRYITRFRKLISPNKQKQKDLESIFSKLVKEGKGEISLIGFKRETGLSSQEAAQYLKEKVKYLNGIYIKRQNNIYYYFKY